MEDKNNIDDTKIILDLVLNEIKVIYQEQAKIKENVNSLIKAIVQFYDPEYDKTHKLLTELWNIDV